MCPCNKLKQSRIIESKEWNRLLRCPPDVFAYIKICIYGNVTGSPGCPKRGSFLLCGEANTRNRKWVSSSAGLIQWLGARRSEISLACESWEVKGVRCLQWRGWALRARGGIFMLFLGKDGDFPGIKEPLFFCPFLVSSSRCHGDCQLSWRWWECHLAWKQGDNEARGSSEVPSWFSPASAGFVLRRDFRTQAFFFLKISRVKAE